MAIHGQDITGKHVVIAKGVLKPEYQDITWRVVLAQGGFGCSPTANGTAVFVQHVRDGEEARYHRGAIERLATESEVEAAQRARAQDATR